MMISTILNRNGLKDSFRCFRSNCLAGSAMLIGESLLLVTPIAVVKTFSLFTELVFTSIGYSFLRIVAGFLLGSLQKLNGALQANFTLQIMFWRFIATIKSVPVASSLFYVLSG